MPKLAKIAIRYGRTYGRRDGPNNRKAFLDLIFIFERVHLVGWVFLIVVSF